MPRPLSPTFVFALVLCPASALLAQGNQAPTDLKPDRFDLKAVDPATSPCADFYAYACKKWMEANPIPPDQASWSHGAKLVLWNQRILRDILEKAAVESAGRTATDQKIGDYYASCMDEPGIEARGKAAIRPELDRINALKSREQLAEELGHLHRITNNLTTGTIAGTPSAVFNFGSTQDLDDASQVVAAADQGGLGLPDRDYYLKDDAKSVETREKYTAHIQKMFELLGETPDKAQAHAQTVLSLETALAKASMDTAKRRDPANLNHKLSAQELRALTPAFPWDQYLQTVEAPPTAHYLVTTPDFFKEVSRLMGSTPLDDWKVYLRWQLVHVSARQLSNAFVQENFDFYGRTLAGQKENRPRWRRCSGDADRDLGEALGRAYVERTFGAEGKERMLKMVKALEAALGGDIRQLDWMSPETKKEALAKLQRIEDKIGYPDRWRDYSRLVIKRGDELGNVFRSSDFEFERQLQKIGKPVDRGEWNITPPTVDAYYDAQLNTINFPAGILQPPYFDKQADDAVNFGAIGAIIGHELTHGFDDQGRKFDATGNLHDWWTADDGKEFERRSKCFVDEYSGFEAVPGVHLNGEVTLGENTADNGGLRIALLALESLLKADGKEDQRIDGLTPRQRFFLAWGQSWCRNATPEALRLQAQTNEHSTAQFRVNGVVSNMPEFKETFGCKAGQPMVRDPACHVW